MSTSSTQESQRPWYREVWPWLLMLPPAFSVAGGVTMIYLANSTSSALVVDDYSRIAEITSERFDRDRRAAELDLKAELTFADDPGRVDVALIAPASVRQPRVLVLNLRHATNPDADREIELVRAGDSHTAAADLLPGRYRLELGPEDGTWRLGGEIMRLGGQVTLEPQVFRANGAGPAVSVVE